MSIVWVSVPCKMGSARPEQHERVLLARRGMPAARDCLAEGRDMPAAATTSDRGEGYTNGSTGRRRVKVRDLRTASGPGSVAACEGRHRHCRSCWCSRSCWCRADLSDEVGRHCRVSRPRGLDRVVERADARVVQALDRSPLEGPRRRRRGSASAPDGPSERPAAGRRRLRLGAGLRLCLGPVSLELDDALVRERMLDHLLEDLEGQRGHVRARER